MIRADATERMTPADWDLVFSVSRPEEREALAKGPSPGRVLALLDSDALFERISKASGVTTISPALYFLVLSRRALKEMSLEDWPVAEYLGSLLAEFGNGARMFRPFEGRGEEFRTLVELVSALASATGERAFLIRTHLGNFALFLAGIFPGWLFHRTHARGAPPLRYFEEMGRSSFGAAARDALARREGLDAVLGSISENFRDVRLALNRLSDDFLRLGDAADPVDAELRRILYR